MMYYHYKHFLKTYFIFSININLYFNFPNILSMQIYYYLKVSIYEFEIMRLDN